MMRHAFSLVGAVFRHESVATSDFSHSSDCSVSPGGWSGSARVVQNSPHVGPSNRVTVPRNHVAGRHACLSPGHKRPAALMAPTSEASNRRAYGPPIMRHALTAIESGDSSPRSKPDDCARPGNPPRCALTETHGMRSQTRRVTERDRGAGRAFPRTRARIEAAVPLPGICALGSGADRDRADMRVVIDVPAFLAGFRTTTAGELGDAPFKRGLMITPAH